MSKNMDSALDRKGHNFSLAYHLVKAYAGGGQKITYKEELGELLEATLEKINELSPESKPLLP